MVSRSTLATFALAVVVLAAATGAVYAFNPAAFPTGDYERATVTVADEADNRTLATVDARIADTHQKRYTGLSETESLGEDEGMLFVHDEEDEYAYVMREMAFPIDIVFVGENGTITQIHHADRPPEGTSGEELTRYNGTGKYVLELPYGYTNRTCIDEGDRIRIGDY
ncbi:hypothetical protein SAMN04488063_0599 [Halopelagius inordinatus]|uniref:DUF192 domain-containing protein n=1 Tax=Halopelagius inordinatus TaxID=553467 RepID=A0A1I2MD04_9EURY|nr:DUF192 domain-containing protein [Halopelagius inordinatus]SFF87091.1 hypothetical protein SAMN04488063_0599 [Halopelagius inordinatus]